MSLGKCTIDNRTMRHLRKSRLSIPNSVHANVIVQELRNHMAPNSWRALRADLRIYFDWADGAGLIGLPADQASMMVFAQWAADTNKSTATTLRYLSSIARLHREAGLANPVTDAVRASVTKPSWTCQAAPENDGVTDRALADAVRTMLHVECLDLIDLRNRLLLGLGWETGGNSQAIVGIDWDDIDLSGGIAPRALIDTRSRGKVSCRISKRTVRDLKAWGEHFTTRQGKVLRRIHKVGTHYYNDFMLFPARPLSSQSVTLCYRNLLGEAQTQGLLSQLDDAEYDRLRTSLSARAVSRISPARPAKR